MPRVVRWSAASVLVAFALGLGPAHSRPRAAGAIVQDLAGLHVAIWTPPGEARVPLVLFSHGFHGCNTQSAALLRAIADAGFMVAAPNHRDASCGEGGALGRGQEPFARPDEWSDETYRDRARDLLTLFDALRGDATLGRRVDWDRVGLIGHSLGGYTVLGLAGGWSSWRRPEVKAVLAWSPYCAPFVAHGDLGALRVPVMYQGGTADLGITPTITRSGGCFDRTGSPAYFVELTRAGHFAWTELNHRYDDTIVAYSVAFLRKYLADGDGAELSRKRPDVVALRAK